tara:strand:- start:4050 stop:5918 length:1869 start_codon:yes stop_codon:yes gene_type:complete
MNQDKILVIEKLNLLSLFYSIFFSTKFKNIYYFSKNPSSTSYRIYKVLFSEKKMKQLNYDSFPGSYYDVEKESTCTINDKFYNDIKKNSGFIDSLLKFKNDPRIELSIKYLLLQTYSVTRAKALFFLKKIIKKNNYTIVFLPCDNVDFSIYLPNSFIPNRLKYTIPTSFIILNKLKEFINRKLILYFATKQVIGLLLYRGLRFGKRKKEKFKIAFDILKSGLHWNDMYHDTFLYDDKHLKPNKILHVIRETTTDEDTIKYFEKKGYPYIEFGKVKISADYYIKRVLIGFYLKTVITNVIRFLTIPSVYSKIGIRVGTDIIQNEIFFNEYDIKVFVARDEYFHTHILRSIILNERGGKTVGFDHGNNCLITQHNAYISFDYFCLWSEFHKKLHEKSLRNTKNVEIIGPGIYGLDKTHNFIKENRVPKWYENLKNKYTIITIIGTTFDPDLYITEEHVLHYYKTTLSVLTKYEDVFIVIKPKSTEFKNRKFKELLKDYKRVHVEEGKNPFTYELIPITDILICINASTVGLEGMAAGKKVLFYEVSDWKEHHMQIYDEHLVSFNSNDLQKNVSWILKGNYLPRKKIDDIRKNYNLIFDGRTNKRFKDVINKALVSVESSKDFSV